MTSKRPQHPSGRPIRYERPKRLGFTRVPDDEPLTPGLRKRRYDTNAIGFTARLNDEFDD